MIYLAETILIFLVFPGASKKNRGGKFSSTKRRRRRGDFASPNVKIRAKLAFFLIFWRNVSLAFFSPFPLPFPINATIIDRSKLKKSPSASSLCLIVLRHQSFMHLEAILCREKKLPLSRIFDGLFVIRPSHRTEEEARSEE